MIDQQNHLYNICFILYLNNQYFYSKLPWKKETRRSGCGSGTRRVSFTNCPRLKTNHSRRRRYSRCPSRHGSSHALYSTDDEAGASRTELTCGSSDTTPSTLNSPRILQEFVNDTHLIPPSWRIKYIFPKCVHISDNNWENHKHQSHPAITSCLCLIYFCCCLYNMCWLTLNKQRPSTLHLI